ncbi:MAG TPA: rhodanese-like domain-containing protein [Chitinophagaceae bacterium]|nr:rhodanese-like domain-containing protein [Chitinophagaceae bacterium]
MKIIHKRTLKVLGIACIVSIQFIIFLIRKQYAIPQKTNSKLLSIITKSLQSSEVPKINVSDAAAHQSSYLFLDSREKEEYNVSHINNSIYVGDKEFDINKVEQFPKDTGIIVYCSVGVRSDKIAKEIIDAGYTNVNNMFGGIFEWINEGYPIFDSMGKSTQNIHAYSRMWGIFVNSNHKVYD